jgi:hypothetical protein
MTIYEATLYYYTRAAKMLFNASLAYWCLVLQIRTSREEF